MTAASQWEGVNGSCAQRACCSAHGPRHTRFSLSFSPAIQSMITPPSSSTIQPLYSRSHSPSRSHTDSHSHTLPPLSLPAPARSLPSPPTRSRTIHQFTHTPIHLETNTKHGTTKRKATHSQIEKRRRERINHTMERLKSQVPACRAADGLHKLDVLQATADYIDYLHSCIAILDPAQNTELQFNHSGAGPGVGDEEPVGKSGVGRAESDAEVVRGLLLLSESPQLVPSLGPIRKMSVADLLQ